MAMLRHFIAILVGVFPFTPATKTLGAERDFLLTAEVLSALEGGPLVVRATLTYRGTRQLSVHPLDIYGFSADIHVPPEWSANQRFRLQSFVFSGSISTETSISPGQSWTCMHYLHRDYTAVPSGTVKLRVKKTIYRPGKWVSREQLKMEFGPLLAVPSTALIIDIPKATPARIRDFAVKLEAEVGQHALTEAASRHITETVLDTVHPEFIPAGLRLLKSGVRVHSDELILWIYDRSRTADAGHAALVGAVVEEGSQAAEMVFSFWQGIRRQASLSYLNHRLPGPGRIAAAPARYLFDNQRLVFDLEILVTHLKARQFRLPDKEFKRLLAAEDVWVRAFTYSTFPDRCDQAWTARLTEDLKRLANPLPAEEFNAFLRQLDAREFLIRERTTRRLIRLGDVVAPALRDALKQQLSAEVRRRVTLILAEIEKPAENHPHSQILSQLGWRNTPQARAILEALASGDPRCRLARDARKALARISHQHFETRPLLEA